MSKNDKVVIPEEYVETPSIKHQDEGSAIRVLDKEQVTIRTFEGLSFVIEKMKNDIHEAVSNIVKDIRIPIQADVTGIHIPLLNISSITDNMKSIISKKPSIDITIHI